MFEEQTVDNLELCLNAVTIHVFLNKAYKLQKQYIWHMIQKTRHMSPHKWTARVIKLNNYLTEFPMLSRVKAKKMDQEEILEVLEIGIPTSWKFQMDKEGVDKSSSTVKEFTKICICYKECKPVIPEKQNLSYMSHSEKEGKFKAKSKAHEKSYRTALMSATSPLPTARTACTMNAKKDPTRSRDLNTILEKKITKAFSHQEKKEKADLNKFEARSISSGSNAGDSNSKYDVSCTSNKRSDS
eukprot:4436295-Ditylum_brightwellii.AAC.1